MVGRSENMSATTWNKRFLSKRDHLLPTDLTIVFAGVLWFALTCVDRSTTPCLSLKSLEYLRQCVVSTSCVLWRSSTEVALVIFFETLCIYFIGCIVGVVSSRSTTPKVHEEVLTRVVVKDAG